MPKTIELTIKADYVPSWGAYEGIREILQNAKDAETEFCAPLAVTYNKKTESMKIQNDGVTLAHEALLLGHSTKARREDLIGQWGEGLKLGLLALVRSGRKVKIRSGSEVWIPKIIRSSTFGADVLAVEIHTGRKERNRVAVEISGVDEEERNSIRLNFLWLHPPKKAERVTVDQGSVLLGSKYCGRLYAKGIFVEHDPALAFGYDFTSARTDRDRRMLDRWDRNWYMAQIWQGAVNIRPDLFEQFYGLLEGDSEDVKNGAEYMDASPEILEKAAEKFIEQFGADAVPVESFGQTKDLEHLGKRGIITAKPLRVLLEKKLGDVAKVMESLKTETIRLWSWHELNPTERQNLEESIRLVSLVEEVTAADLDVVDFRNQELWGQYGNGHIRLARWTLSDREKCLWTLVHETAHRVGGDGDKSHVFQMETIWSGIVGFLRGA